MYHQSVCTCTGMNSACMMSLLLPYRAQLTLPWHCLTSREGHQFVKVRLVCLGTLTKVSIIMDFDLTMLNNNDNDNLESISPEDRTKLMEELICKCKNVLTQNPSNLCCKYAVEYLSSEKANDSSNKIGTCAFTCLLAMSFNVENH